MNTLTQSERQVLKAKAHQLKPVVMIGGKGLTESVHAEIARALFDHELIKVRLPGTDHDARDAMIEAICATHGAGKVQRVGNVVVLFKARAL
jgi:RNA-binding protein